MHSHMTHKGAFSEPPNSQPALLGCLTGAFVASFVTCNTETHARATRFTDCFDCLTGAFMFHLPTTALSDSVLPNSRFLHLRLERSRKSNPKFSSTSGAAITVIFFMLLCEACHDDTYQHLHSNRTIEESSKREREREILRRRRRRRAKRDDVVVTSD